MTSGSDRALKKKWKKQKAFFRQQTNNGVSVVSCKAPSVFPTNKLLHTLTQHQDQFNSTSLGTLFIIYIKCIHNINTNRHTHIGIR